MTVLKSAYKFSAKAVNQNVRTGIPAERAFKNYHWKWRTEMLPKSVSTKPVFQNVRTERLADWRIVREDYQTKDRTEMLPKVYPQKQPVKTSLLNC